LDDTNSGMTKPKGLRYIRYMQLDWDQVPEQPVFPGYRAKFIHTDSATFAFWNIDAGAVLPEHNHLHEQITHVLEGTFDLTIDGVTHTLSAGATAFIPPHAMHGGLPKTNCRILDIFHPRREDYVAMNSKKHNE
jgi:quercetin dioxygenase-like cupin family protein